MINILKIIIKFSSFFSTFAIDKVSYNLISNFTKSPGCTSYNQLTSESCMATNEHLHSALVTACVVLSNFLKIFDVCCSIKGTM